MDGDGRGYGGGRDPWGVGAQRSKFRQGADVTLSRCCYIFLELVDTPTISLNGTSVAHHNLWISPGPDVNVEVGPPTQVHNLVLLSLDGCSRVPT